MRLLRGIGFPAGRKQAEKEKREENVSSRFLFRIRLCADLFGDGSFEEAYDGADDRKNTAEDRPDGELFRIESGEGVFHVRAAEADGSEAGRAEEEYGAYDEAGGRNDLRDEPVFKDQRENAADQGKEKAERRHNIEFERVDGDAPDDFDFPAEGELHAGERKTAS